MIDFGEFAENSIQKLNVGDPKKTGTLVRVVGMTLEARGLVAPLGAMCQVDSVFPGSIDAEVVGFQNDILYLMPFGEPEGIGPGARVRIRSTTSKARVGRALLGRVIDGFGHPLDGRPEPQCEESFSLQGNPINPMERTPISEQIDVGVKAINGLLTLGRGQRIGLIAGSGVGKSVLLGMMTRFSQADVVIIGLIGERGREVKEFISENLGVEGLSRSVVVAAPSNVSPVLRLRATHLTHRIAEYFRDLGMNVMMLVDSLTRVAHAQREVGLAVGEPPTSKGYPPSVFGLLPNLIERSGTGREGQGCITAVYTVLAEADDASDPIVDIARASLDGQVMLTRALADAALYPAIDLAGSVSRIMPAIVSPQELEQANKFRRLWTLYQQNKDLIQVGAYQKGSNPEVDEAITKRSAMENFVRQGMDESFDFQTTRQKLQEIG